MRPRAALTRKPALVLLGHIAQRHPHYADIRALAAALAELTGATLGYLSEGANARAPRSRARAASWPGGARSAADGVRRDEHARDAA